MLEGRRVSGERIRQARLKAGMSQMQLARAVGVSERNVVRWETGKNQPRAEHVFAIADACSVHVLDLYEESRDTDEPLTRAQAYENLGRAMSAVMKLEVAS